MKSIHVETPDVNSETCVIVRWYVGDGAHAERYSVIAEIETSKAMMDVTTEHAGYLLHSMPEGSEISLSEPIAFVFESLEELERHREMQEREARAAPKPVERGYRATLKAEARARELGIELAALDTGRLITTRDVEAAAWKSRSVDVSTLPALLGAPDAAERILLIGAGGGATQVLDILGGDARRVVVGILTDDAESWGREVSGVPVVGGTDRLASLFESRGFDKVIVTTNTSIPARTRFRELCKRLGVPLANAIDPSVRRCSGVEIGTGNVICAFVHLGNSTVVGDNNFISAYNSFDHHNQLGSDISTGPGCMTSGSVIIGDRVRLGTGIFVEPHLEIGEGAIVASGSVIVNSVPAGHAVKLRAGRSEVVPIRRPS